MKFMHFEILISTKPMLDFTIPKDKRQVLTYPEAYSEPCQTSKIELFTKIVHG